VNAAAFGAQLAEFKRPLAQETMAPPCGALRIRTCLGRKPYRKRGRFGHRGGIADKTIMDDAIAATRIIPTEWLLPRSFE
jgi:hypothetical protein